MSDRTRLRSGDRTGGGVTGDGGSSTLDAPTVLIVGGGRWARTLLAALTDVGVDSAHIGVVSARNSPAVRTWSGATEVWADLRDAISSRVWSAAIVANLPSEHHAAARALLEAGIPTLIEKPVVATLEEAADLVAVAQQSGTCSLRATSCSHLRGLPDLDHKRGDGPIELWWHESPTLHRDGTPRVPDLTTGVVSDYLPHLLAVLGTSIALDGANVDSVALAEDGSVSVGVSAGSAQISIRVSRSGEPSRGISWPRSGGVDTFDLVASAERPLQRELAAFVAAGRSGDLPNTVAKTLDIVRLTEQACSELQNVRDAALVAQLRRGTAAPISPAVLDTIVEAMALALVDVGLAQSVKDAEAVRLWAGRAWRVVAHLADDPFVDAGELIAITGASRSDYLKLCEVTARWDAGQRLIMSGGRARKYWTNTIGPLLMSGSVQAVLSNTALFPLRIGLYPGLSCMFHCTFCGRHPDARYDRESVDAGYRRFVDLFDQAPGRDRHRFYLSGGLEPLTNPRIGDIVTAGAARGFDLSLYTNALMLTPSFWSRHPGLADLDVLRISLYGTDATSALAVTGHRRSFDQVITNVITTLQLRQENGFKTRIGLNHVILPNRPNVIDELIELIVSINRDAATSQGIDFLTLREDYGATAEGGVSDHEREQLRTALGRLQSEAEPGGRLAGLTVDLGYALDPLLQDWPARPLRFAKEIQLRSQLYPQVSVAIDILGDTYGYREAAFLERPGGSRFIIGRIDDRKSLMDIVTNWVDSSGRVDVQTGDLAMLDIFDHVVTLILSSASADIRLGIPPESGPIRLWRASRADHAEIALAHPFAVAPETRR